VEFSVRSPSLPNTYSYVQEENLGSTRKSIEIYLLFTCITNLILVIQMQSVNGLEEPFYLRQQKKYLTILSHSYCTMRQKRPKSCWDLDGACWEAASQF
jgi:hypothetical protein